MAHDTEQTRAGPTTDDDGRRGHIMVVAARLFRERGYLNTTMTEIARECGLGQSSLYYWFRQKEDILLGLLALNRVSLDFAEQVVAETGSPAVRLLRLLRLDMLELCSSSVDICEVEVLAEQQPAVFAEFWADTAALHGHIGTLISDGIACGEFIECDPEFVALNICAAEEGVQRRYRNSAAHAPGGNSPFRHQDYSREHVASELAAILVRGLLRDPTTLPNLIAAAAAHHDVAPSTSSASAPTGR
ncbi:TetR/AcrR family transcriptional regulator [Mycolicibacterium stellerae]|uniref:TetR/AcrR family transcriptional regulator n=1 Tax=Mycolicibacterium stellerae TaxID=2358193 RepID=UPI000F0B4E79|nr:helix-turn-helix domain-containing protein [Mycolicibacterium stellerae]